MGLKTNLNVELVIFNHLLGLERVFAFALNEFQFRLDGETALVYKIHIGYWNVIFKCLSLSLFTKIYWFNVHKKIAPHYLPYSGLITVQLEF